MRRLFLLLTVAIGLGGVGSASAALAPCPAPASTYDLLQRGVFEQYGCTVSYCHGAARTDGLDLRAGNSYDSLLHPDESGDGDEGTEGGSDLVVPGRPQDSLLWEKLAVKTLNLAGVPGAGMPLDGLPLSTDALAAVRLWILAGAPESGFVNGVDRLVDACPPSNDDNVAALPECQPGERNLLLPDLVTDVPRDVQLLYRDGHRLLMFTTGVANYGTGPLIVQAATPATQPGQTLEALQVVERLDGSKCTHPAGTITFVSDGAHWAYGHTVDFELRKDDPYTGPIVAQGSKTAFCLLDTDPISQKSNLPHQFEAHCTDNIGRMGISVGYMDVYHRIHPGQWIDLDSDPSAPVPTGTYYLVNIANPLSTLLETDTSTADNLNFKTVSVNLNSLVSGNVAPTPAPPAPTPQPPSQPPAHTVHQPTAPHQPAAPGSARSVHAPHQPHSPSARLPVHAPQAPQVGRVPSVPERPVSRHVAER